MDIYRDIKNGQSSEEDFRKSMLSPTLEELKYSIRSEIMKAKKAEIGEMRTWSGVRMRKEANGWVPVREGGEPTKKEEGGGENKTTPDLAEHAKTASEAALQNAIKASNDPKVREAAHKELQRRKGEEATEQFKAPEESPAESKKESSKENDENKGDAPGMKQDSKEPKKEKKRKELFDQIDSMRGSDLEDFLGLEEGETEDWDGHDREEAINKYLDKKSKIKKKKEEGVDKSSEEYKKMLADIQTSMDRHREIRNARLAEIAKKKKEAEDSMVTSSGKKVSMMRDAKLEKTYTSKDHKDAAYVLLDSLKNMHKVQQELNNDRIVEEFDRHISLAHYKEMTEKLSGRIEKSLQTEELIKQLLLGNDIHKSHIDDFSYSSEFSISKTGKELKEKFQVQIQNEVREIKELFSKLTEHVNVIGELPDKDFKTQYIYMIDGYEDSIPNIPMVYSYDYDKVSLENSETDGVHREKFTYNECVNKMVRCYIEVIQLNTLIRNLTDSKQYKLNIKQASQLGF